MSVGTITLHYCQEHDTWSSRDCAECLLAANKEDLIQEGRQQVAEWVEANQLHDPRIGHFALPWVRWYDQLRKWGVRFKSGKEVNKEG